MNTNEPYITKVYLLDVPLENKYKDTFAFSSHQEQRDYFESKIVQTFGYENFSYQRKDSTIRFPVHIDTLRGNVNYVMYQNTYYSNKWFYAFITDMKYINDGCTEISIETDVIQTWLLDYTVNSSFIEREHTLDDTIGANTLPENLETGEYVLMSNNKITSIFDKEYCKPVIALTEIISPLSGVVTNVNPEYQPDVPQGVYYVMVEKNLDIQEIIAYYDEQGKGEAVQSVFIVPEILFPNSTLSPLWENCTLNFSSQQPYTFKMCRTPYWRENVVGGGNVSLGLKSYTPRNNKLQCFPYKYLELSNENGQSTTLHLENFTNGNFQNFQFKIFGILSPSCNFRCIPVDYKTPTSSSGQNFEIDYDEGITIAKFPIGNWSNDVYTNWLTQNALNISTQTEFAKFKSDFGMTNSALNGVGSILSGLASVLGGDSSGIGTAISGFTSNAMSGYYSYANGYYDIQRINAMKYEHSLTPPVSKGNLNSGDVGFSFNYISPRLKAYSIKPEYARIIDDYFDMYGYQTNRVKIPNSWHRKEWWYTKTINANITGAIPNDDMAKIINIYDNGITFWTDPDHIYNYGLPNPIV